MGEVREVDAISDAIIATEREIAGDAWGFEETDALDASGDRALEELGEGLEGQHEAEDDDGTEGETEGDEETDGDGQDEDEGEGDGEKPPIAAADKDGKGKTEPEQPPRREAEGRVPSGKLREANERARLAEEERNKLRDQLKDVDQLKTQVATLTSLLQGQRQPPPVQPQETKTELPKEEPDIFENPKGFVKSIKDEIQSAIGSVRNDLRETNVATSFRIAHVRHGDAFPKAMEAVGRLNPQNPDDRATVQRIYNSPDPGEALVSWHKRSETLARVGDDPTAYEERIRRETREALTKDPEFIKQVVASLRGEAEHGDNGSPRTTHRLPKSLNRATGSNLGGQRIDPRSLDDSDQAVAESAWR